MSRSEMLRASIIGCKCLCSCTWMWSISGFRSSGATKKHFGQRRANATITSSARLTSFSSILDLHVERRDQSLAHGQLGSSSLLPFLEMLIGDLVDACSVVPAQSKSGSVDTGQPKGDARVNSPAPANGLGHAREVLAQKERGRPCGGRPQVTLIESGDASSRRHGHGLLLGSRTVDLNQGFRSSPPYSFYR